MTSSTRRTVLAATLLLPFVVRAREAAPSTALARAVGELAKLEAKAGGRLGVAAYEAGKAPRVAHRADERFPMCSTFKTMAAGAVLKRSATDAGLLTRRVTYAKSDLVTYSPITEKHVAEGMTVAELCAAALQYSDNTAGNLLMQLVGGPQGVTAFARSIGDEVFRLDRWETALNTAIPGDERDTTSPAAMARSYERLLLGDALPPAQRMQLRDWMLGNTTGASRIRAGVPPEWKVADKTGTGDYGTTNDAGIAWPAADRALVMVIYFTQPSKGADAQSGVIAEAARLAAAALA
ncbi:class A beta-lactamase [Massilia arenosa]|uniref:Beta-lactamase n=1 Tax=Zemynaea arenosa TaxID=2561931 RepID=A0A4Y9SIT0_9BURK|nr:class A beta-lactamase [Massilia arenosa]TFW25527.1 class A beta-lactamase [Massilia arenosa]